MSAPRAPFLRLFVAPCRGIACSARSWPRLSPGSVAAAFRGGRIWRLEQTFCRTDTHIYAEPRRVCALGLDSLLGHSSSKPKTGNLPLTTSYSGAPPLVCKGGLLRPEATVSLQSPPAFPFHESLPPEAQP